LNYARFTEYSNQDRPITARPPMARTMIRTTARPTLPIVAHATVSVRAEDRKRIDRLAARLLEAEPALATISAFGERVSAGLTDGPALLFEDHSEIALLARSGDAMLEYRSLLLAGDGDIVLIGGQRSPPFEAYCRDILALGEVTVLSVPASAVERAAGLARRCAADSAVLEAARKAARRSGHLNLIPYIGTGSAWTLASRIAAHADVHVAVAAPPPRLTRRVNDKLWFASRVKELLGSDSLPPSYHAFGPAALTGRVAALANRFERVVIKVPDSAGSAGNLVLSAPDLRPLPLRILRGRLLRLLRNLGWRNRFPLMVGVWDCAVLGSPSVQTWIPRPEEGPPIVEGVFDQVVAGSAGEFVGAVPCTMPQEWHQRLVEEAMLIACLFQRLGYFGRCSFDAVLAGNRYANADLHWIECNGRWGGTSIPMTLANRLLGDWARRSFMVVQRTSLTNPPCDVTTALEQLGPLLFRTQGPGAGVVLLTPGGLEAGSGLHFLLLGRSDADLGLQAGALRTHFVAEPG